MKLPSRTSILHPGGGRHRLCIDLHRDGGWVHGDGGGSRGAGRHSSAAGPYSFRRRLLLLSPTDARSAMEPDRSVVGPPTCAGRWSRRGAPRSSNPPPPRRRPPSNLPCTAPSQRLGTTGLASGGAPPDPAPPRRRELLLLVTAPGRRLADSGGVEARDGRASELRQSRWGRGR
ncbi:unnamed protein product [Urochloa humidicola]